MDVRYRLTNLFIQGGSQTREKKRRTREKKKRKEGKKKREAEPGEKKRKREKEKKERRGKRTRSAKIFFNQVFFFSPLFHLPCIL